jgi:hypothetical protein
MEVDVHAVGPGGALSGGGRGAPRRGRRHGDLGLHAAVDGGRTSKERLVVGAVLWRRFRLLIWVISSSFCRYICCPCELSSVIQGS